MSDIVQSAFNNIPTGAAGVGALGGVGDRITNMILEGTPADRKESVGNVLKMSSGFLSNINDWISSLPPSALETPKVVVPQYVAPKIEIPKDFKLSDFPQFDVKEFVGGIQPQPQVQQPAFQY